jgi:hypothetical protein
MIAPLATNAKTPIINRRDKSIEIPRTAAR